MGCLAASVVGSQLPDADQRGSKVHRLSYTERRVPLLAVIGLLARLAGLACEYVLHTLADACTSSGSPLLGPFDRTRGACTCCPNAI